MTTTEDVIKAMERVRSHMLMYYNVDLDDLEITHVPGYWQDKEPKMHPGHPLHGCLFCEGPFWLWQSKIDPVLWVMATEK